MDINADVTSSVPGGLCGLGTFSLYNYCGMLSTAGYLGI